MAKDTRELTTKELADVTGGCGGFLGHAGLVSGASAYGWMATMAVTGNPFLAAWSARLHAGAAMAEIASGFFGGGHGHGDSSDVPPREGDQGSSDEGSRGEPAPVQSSPRVETGGNIPLDPPVPDPSGAPPDGGEPTVEELAQENEELRTENEELQGRIDALQRQLDAT
jgi:hypothetical protein